MWKSLIALALLVSVGACQTLSPEEQQARIDEARSELIADGMTQITGAENIRALFEGNTLYKNGGEWEWAGFYHSDGSMDGRAWWPSGDKTGEGVWSVTDNTFCTKWDNDWGNGVQNCLELFIGEDDSEITFLRVSGEGDLVDHFTPKPDNPYEL